VPASSASPDDVASGGRTAKDDPMPKWFALALCGLGALLFAIGMASVEPRAGDAPLDAHRRTRRRVAREARLGGRRAGRAPLGFVIRYAYEARGGAQESEQVWMGSAAAGLTDEARARMVWSGSPPGAW
jgi:hypothetical protein